MFKIHEFCNKVKLRKFLFFKLEYSNLVNKVNKGMQLMKTYQVSAQYL